jgi:peptidoglycan/xylan/chitin deacetylase (PgdA/CDA1 family)
LQSAQRTIQLDEPASHRGPVSAIGSSTAMRQTIQVVFRYDDCNSESSTALEYSLLDAFEAVGIPLTFGVTPFITAGEVDDPTPCAAIPLHAEKIAMLRRAVHQFKGEVALHGYSHQTVRAAAGGSCSEFVGVPLEQQIERLAAGRRFLERNLEARVTTLVPPWNSYDENTLKAAACAGLTTVSADLEGAAPAGSPLHFIPATCSLGGLKQAVRWARTTADASPLIVVVFHPFDFESYAKPRPVTIGELGQLLAWVAGQRDIRVETISSLSIGMGDFSSARLSRYQSKVRRREKLRLPTRLVKRRVYTSMGASGGSGRGALLAGVFVCIIALACLAAKPWATDGGDTGAWASVVPYLAILGVMVIALKLVGLHKFHRRFVAALALLGLLGSGGI